MSRWGPTLQLFKRVPSSFIKAEIDNIARQLVSTSDKINKNVTTLAGSNVADMLIEW